MNLPPLPQQVLATDFILEHPEAALFLDAGLGKSRSTLDAIKTLMPDGAIRGALIIAPLRVATLAWPSEVERWGGVTIADMRTEAGVKSWEDGTADIYTINYEMLQTFAAKHLKGKKHLPVDMLVWDEVNKARNPTSKRIKAILPYRKMFKRHIGLTGTPTPNSALDLWGQMRVIDGGERLGPSYHAFRSRYAESDFMQYNWTLTQGSDQLIWDKIRDITLVLRAQEYLDIPPVGYQDIDVVLPPAVMRDYKKLQKDMLLEIEGKEVVALSAAALVQKLSQFTSGASYHMENERRGVVQVHDEKLHALAKLHKSLNFRPLLVLVQFVHEADRILKSIPHAQAFDEKDIGKWNEGKIPLWVAHPASMGHGLNLQGKCCDICWFSMTYSFDMYSQANSRIARTGQTRPTTIYRLMCPNTIDWATAEVLRSKESGENSLKAALRHVKKLANFSEAA